MKRFLLPFALAGIAAAGAFQTPARAQTNDNAEVQALREQIRLLDQKLRVLERKQEIKDEEAAAAAKSTAKVTINDRGFTFASGDGANSLRLRGLVQADSRWFIGDGIGNNDAFVLRRARLIAEGTFNRWVEYQLVPEFAGSSVSVLDANVNLAFSKELQLRFGKFKTPVGLEQLQSDSWAYFIERSLVTNLVPNRDVGLLLAGDLLGGALTYQAGVFNGVADGASSSNTDFDDDKEFVARVFAHPFRQQADSPFAGLGLGVSASWGSTETAAGLTGGYRTDGQQTFFRYRATALADGDTWRLSPQAYYYRGPLGLLTEYVVSAVNVRPGATGEVKELKHDAWQLAAGYVLTGEDASYRGVVPKQTFDLANGTWGAFEVTARFAELDLDDDTFPTFADPAASASQATSFGVGLNWYLTKSLRASVNYFQTNFDNGSAPAASNAVIREDERSILTRLQLVF